jgi:hypothetical protein
MPIYETGHARNLEHFQQMISYVTSWGATYTPTNTEIAPPSLLIKKSAVSNAIAAVTTANAAFKAATNDRENTFSGLRKLVTRAVNFYKSKGPAQNQIDSVASLQRKINGKRAEVLQEDDPSTPENEAGNSISASQQSYTQLVEHFQALIEILDADAAYDPAETDLQITALNTLKTSMTTANTVVMNAAVPLSTNRATRDEEMYADHGLVDLAQKVKNYVKAAYGTDSMQYNQIKSLKFTRPR